MTLSTGLAGGRQCTWRTSGPRSGVSVGSAQPYRTFTTALSTNDEPFTAFHSESSVASPPPKGESRPSADQPAAAMRDVIDGEASIGVGEVRKRCKGTSVGLGPLASVSWPVSDDEGRQLTTTPPSPLGVAPDALA